MSKISLKIHPNRRYLPYITPAVAMMFLLSIFPSVFLYLISLTNYQLGWAWDKMQFVGLQNYYRLFSGQDLDFWNAVKLSLLFMIIATGIEVVLGFLIGKLLNDTESRMKTVMFSILIIPIVMTPSIAGNIWKLMLNAEYGIVNHILGSLGVTKIAWLNTQNAFFSVLLADVWQWTPFVALLFYAGFRSLPYDQYEAAKVDGANSWQLFRHITVPALKPLTYLALLFRTADSLKIYDMPFVLTQGGPGNATEFLSLRVFRLANAQNGLIGRAAANAVVLLILSTLISRLVLRMQKRGEEK